ncbi:MAG: hypothetical protein LQ351_006129 [Letrouitia transgressa]|nr:MAG: hypothetical protein LQ351_006129 [Letrouitia transgressa]
MHSLFTKVNASIGRHFSSVTQQGSLMTDDDNASIASYESGDEKPCDDGYQSLNVNPKDSTAPCYNPLKSDASQIRLLTLAPSFDKRSDIHCHLEHVYFGDKAANQPIYEALSYTWGNKADKRVIFVNDDPTPITRNLDIALRYIRNSSESRILWIDALCIDQSNLEEKAQQVEMMKDIYRDASQVLVWLGESDKDIRQAMQRIKKLEAPGYLEAKQVGPFYDPFIAGLDKIFRKSWWSRLWVVQEVIMARNPPLVGCGRKWVSWKAFQKAMVNLALAKTDYENFLENPTALLNLGLMPTPYSTHTEQQRTWWRRLENVLNATTDRETTEPQDQIFALLGLMDQDTAKKVVVDYSEPISNTYQKAMVCVLESASNLDFLVKAMHQKKAYIPSWCVDFSQPSWNKHSYGQGWSIFLKDDHGASGKLPKPGILHNLDEGTLRISGSILGEIRHVVTSELGSPGEARFRSILRNLITFTVAAEPALKNRFGEAKTFHMLTSGELWKVNMNPGGSLYINPGGLNETQKQALPMKFSEFEKIFKGDTNAVKIVIEEWSALGLTFPESFDLQKWAVSTLYYAGLRMDDETFLATDTGYIGVTPAGMNAIEKGDFLAIIHGCNLPLILRPKGYACELITFAYVSDLMGGECFDSPGWDSQTLTFC